MNMNKVLQHSRLFLKKNASTILTCIGGAGVVVTTVMAVKATPKALVTLEKAKEEKGDELTTLEVVKTAGPAYIPTVIAGTATIACIFGANILNQRQQAALMSAYALLDNSYKEYKAKVTELYGEDADDRVREEIAKDKYDENLYPWEDNKVLFYDEYSQKYFETTVEDVIQAEYILNHDFHYHGVACLNEFYDLLKLPRMPFGDVLGWTTAFVGETQWYEWIEFYHKKVELEDGMECYILEILTEPIPNFEDW